MKFGNDHQARRSSGVFQFITDGLVAAARKTTSHAAHA